MKEQKRLSKWLYWFILGVAIIAVYKLLDNLGPITNFLNGLLNILMPFVIGLLIAYLFYIPCRALERKYKKVKFLSKKARGLSIVTVYLIAILIVVLALTFVVPNIVKSIADFVANFGDYYNSTLERIQNLPEDSIWKSDAIMGIVQNLSQIDLKEYLNIEKIMQYVQGAISAVSGVFNIFVSFIVSVYLLSERRQILQFLKRLAGAIFPKGTYEMVGRYFNKSNEVFFKYISGQVLDAIIVGILTSVAMSILGVKYAILLGFTIGLFNLIPYFGAIVAVIIAILVTIFTGGLGQAILMAIVVIILQQIDANIINPKIIGNSLSISPLLVIFAVTVGGAYFGVLGMFLSVPVCTVIKLLIEEYIEYKEKDSETGKLS